MIKTLIKANPLIPKDFVEDDGLGLFVSEFFYDAIQGEGINTGQPAAFLRLQGCTLNCSYCDTKKIRDTGNLYSYTELFDLMEKYPSGGMDLIYRLEKGQHLVITGGSPLKQQTRLIGFIQTFISNFGFKPFIEIENECTIFPETDLIRLVDVWNNSPKLANSGNLYFKRYKPGVLKMLSCLSNSWFKFVICDVKECWNGIEIDFLIPKHILKEQIILMPQGTTRKEILKNAPAVIALAVSKNVRFSLRDHIILWNGKVGT